MSKVVDKIRDGYVAVEDSIIMIISDGVVSTIEEHPVAGRILYYGSCFAVGYMVGDIVSKIRIIDA